MLLRYYMPGGLIGLAVIALGAAIMSTVSANLNFGAQVFINDIYKRCFFPAAQMSHYITVGRIVTVVILVLSITVATVAENVIDISVFMLGLSSAELTANWGQWWWWRFNAKARIAASLGGPLLFLLNKFYIIPTVFPDTLNPEYLVVFNAMGMTLLLWITVALLTKPDPEPVLLEFYRRAKPLGWWGPIAAQAGVESRGGSPIFKGLLIALVGATAVSSGIIAFSCLYIARWEVAGWALVIMVVLGGIFLPTYNRFINSLQEDIESRDALELARLSDSQGSDPVSGVLYVQK
jgi:hypothetical protein